MLERLEQVEMTEMFEMSETFRRFLNERLLKERHEEVKKQMNELQIMVFDAEVESLQVLEKLEKAGLEPATDSDLGVYACHRWHLNKMHPREKKLVILRPDRNNRVCFLRDVQRYLVDIDSLWEEGTGFLVRKK